MKSISKIVTALATIASLATVTPALAQYGSRRETQVDRRDENQQDRIAAGVRSGQLSPREAARLERQSASIRHAEYRREADGRFTRRDQRRIDHRLNRESRAIYRLRHNGR